MSRVGLMAARAVQIRRRRDVSLRVAATYAAREFDRTRQQGAVYERAVETFL